MFPLSESGCQESVSILHAIVFGADGACVMLDISSILMALIPFVLGVSVLQWIVRRQVAKVFGKRGPDKKEKASDKTGPLDIEYDGGPIRTRKGLW